MNSKVIFCVCDDKCKNKAKAMLDSFNKYNDDFDSIVFTYGHFNVGEYRCINFAIDVAHINIETFDKCEIYRFFAARKLLKTYDTVIYCDCDCLFFDKVPEFHGQIAACEHFVDWENCKNLNTFVRNLNIINIGFMVFNKTKDYIMDYICEMCMSKEDIIFLDKINKRRIRLQPFMTIMSHFCNDFEVIKNYGINVAYWNLKSDNLSDERDIIKIGDKYFVNNENTPLIMFHFSGNRDDVFTRFNGSRPCEYYGKYIREITNYWRCLCR